MHFMLKCPAWAALSPVGAKLYIEIAKRYNGQNNGEISLSVREAAAAVRCDKDRAHEGLRELQDKGFICATTLGSFHRKGGNATEWRLTVEPTAAQLSTKEFMRWQPPTPGKK